MNLMWGALHLLPLLGFLLALVLLVHLTREQGAPSGTIAWLLAIMLVPYVGVPLYLMFGGRKMRRMARQKAQLPIKGRPDGYRESDEKRPLAAVPEGTFAPRGGNRIALLATGEAAFHTLMQSIEGAEDSICITTFILRSDSTGRAIVDALARRARDGVRVYLLLDALGSGNAWRHLLSGFRAAGGQCALFMPMLHLPFRGRANLRNHRKMALFDCTTAIIGGMNLAYEYMGPTIQAQRWHDLSLTVSGPVVSDLYWVFRSDWAFAAKGEPALPEQPASGEGPGDVRLQLLPSGPDVAGDPLHDEIVASLAAAQKRIWIATPYFIPDEVLQQVLCISARRGVDVRVVVPAASNHWLADMVRRGYLRQVQDNGGKVWLFKPGMLHAKVFVIDDSLGIVGSMNMDMRSLFLNYEIALLVRSEPVVAGLAAWVSRTMEDSELGVKGTSVPVEFAEDIAKLLAPLL
jgi:cardiolipin synthase